MNEWYWRGFMSRRLGLKFGPRPRGGEQQEEWNDGYQNALALERAERKEKAPARP